MLEKALNILRTRWPEVMLVVVLQAAMMLLAEEVVTLSEKGGSQGLTLPFWAGFLLGLGMILCAILWQMIYLGFLKTATETGSQPQHPMQLLQAGRPYFWRILFFQVMLGFVLMFLNMVIMTIAGVLIFKGRQLDQIPEWFMQACALVGILIVLKPMLLVPARILVYDSSTFQAIFQTRFYQLGQIDQFFKVAMAGFGVIFLSMLPTALFKPSSPIHYLASGFHHGVFSVIILTLTLIAVLWVQQQLELEYVQSNEDNA